MIIGVDIGGTKTAVAGFEDRTSGLRRVTEVCTVETPAALGGTRVTQTVIEAVESVRGRSRLDAVGIGTAGVVKDGIIRSATDAIGGWVGFPLGAAVSDALGVPVGVMNDVHAAALAESGMGAGVSAESLLMVAVGTGIGGAVVLADGLRRGATGSAGSIGHLDVALPDELAGRICPCGGVGHVEAVASGPGLERTYVEYGGPRSTLREVSAAALAGDERARRVIDEGARFLGRAMASANAVLDAELIVLGGGVAQIGEGYRRAVEDEYRGRSLPGPARARVVAALLGVDAAVTGAALAMCESRIPTQPPA